MDTIKVLFAELDLYPLTLIPLNSRVNIYRADKKGIKCLVKGRMDKACSDIIQTYRPR